MSLVTVIPVGIDNAARAEFLVDFISQLNQRKPRGHALIVFDGTHPEFIDRIKISAEMAFSSFDLLVPATINSKDKMASAIARRNHIFMSAALHCQSNYKHPWLWLEPESTPTNPKWIENIEQAYDSQVRRYYMTHLRDSETSPRFPLSVGVWHQGAYYDMQKAMDAAPEIPFERVAGEMIVSKSTKSRMFQPLKIQDEASFQNVWPEAQIVVGDTAGGYTEFLRGQGVHLPKAFPGVTREDESWRAGIDLIPDHPDFKNQERETVGTITPKIDLRTKAGRALKAANNGHEKV